MKITFIKENRDAGTESISTCDTGTFIAKIKSETKAQHVSGLRTMLKYTNGDNGGNYEHIAQTAPAYAPVWNTDAPAKENEG